MLGKQHVPCCQRCFGLTFDPALMFLQFGIIRKINSFIELVSFQTNLSSAISFDPYAAVLYEKTE